MLRSNNLSFSPKSPTSHTTAGDFFRYFFENILEKHFISEYITLKS